MQQDDGNWVCTHRVCYRCDSDDNRMHFHSRSGVLRHTKLRKYHPCAFVYGDEDARCEACLELAGKMSGNKLRTPTQYVCRHASCTQCYAQSQSRRRHEIGVVHDCSESECPECTRTDPSTKKRRIAIAPELAEGGGDNEGETMGKVAGKVQNFTEMMLDFMKLSGGFTVTPPAECVDVIESGQDAFVFWVDGGLGKELPATIHATNIAGLLTCSDVDPLTDAGEDADAEADAVLSSIEEAIDGS